MRLDVVFYKLFIGRPSQKDGLVMNTKPIIKLQLSHYNSIQPVQPIDSTPVTTPLPSITKAQPTTKDEPPQIAEANEEADMQLFDELVESARWECPCGKRVNGPIQYFQHVKQQHQYDTLEQLLQQKTLRRVIDLYPKISRTDIDIIQQLDTTPMLKAIQQIAKKHQQSLKDIAAPEVESGGRGTFGDLASRFTEEMGRETAEGSILRIFFSFLKEYVGMAMGSDAWSQESPNSLLRSSNKIFAYFAVECGGRFGPLQEQDIRRLIYLLAKWMFLNHWTSDRIFPLPPEQPKQEQEAKDDQRK